MHRKQHGQGANIGRSQDIGQRDDIIICIFTSVLTKTPGITILIRFSLCACFPCLSINVYIKQC